MAKSRTFRSNFRCLILKKAFLACLFGSFVVLIIGGCAGTDPKDDSLTGHVGAMFTGKSKAKKNAMKKLRGDGKPWHIKELDANILISSDYEKIGKDTITRTKDTVMKTSLFAIPNEGKIVILRILTKPCLFCTSDKDRWNESQQANMKMREFHRWKQNSARRMDDKYVENNCRIIRWTSPFVPEGWRSVPEHKLDRVVQNYNNYLGASGAKQLDVTGAKLTGMAYTETLSGKFYIIYLTYAEISENASILMYPLYLLGSASYNLATDIESWKKEWLSNIEKSLHKAISEGDESRIKAEKEMKTEILGITSNGVSTIFIERAQKSAGIIFCFGE